MAQKLTIALSTIVILASFGTNASALAITDPNVVGMIKGGEQDASVATETMAGNYLLAMSANTTDSNGPFVGGVGGPWNNPVTRSCNISTSDGCYATSATEYSGILSGGTQSGGTSVGAGWDYVMAKYNGPNGGWVLWYIGGNAVTLPATSDDMWENPSGEGFAISHYTTFNRTTTVPDGGTTLALLGVALGGLGLIRRRFSA
jgi:hypothetical protein